MTKYAPALRIALLGSLVVIAVAMALNLLVGNTTTPFQMIFPLLCVLGALGTLTAVKYAPPKCPSCTTQQPTLRKPTSLHQGLFGGWTCPTCGTEIDRKGHAATPDRA